MSAVEINARLAPAVLLRVKRGEKRPIASNWQNLRLGDMTAAYFAGFNGDNIGVSLGAASSGLCTVDIDDDAALGEFLGINPDLRRSLISHGGRGGNAWVRISGEFPRSAKIKTSHGKPWGEWRAGGNQTVIHGLHPSGRATGTTAKGRLRSNFRRSNGRRISSSRGLNPKRIPVIY